ncbi:hypothetical protein GCM10009789_46590 [Kribbella sancticallisti]|uniref:Glycosyltransferase family 9 (Heptosyltransferase) n=1 Tax=Kribbella sancticallisti TaxID=460087 RepID=A0ABN2DYJ2_9ACTN
MGECSVDDLRLTVSAEPDGAVVVHPGAASVARQWPLSRWGSVIRELAADGRHVVLTGSERELCAQLAGEAEDLSGRLSLEGLAARVASAALVLSGDTGVAHLATAVGTRSVTLFGPTPPRWWGPTIDLDRHTVLYHGVGAGNPHADQPDAALLRITVAEVLATARNQLACGTSRPSWTGLPASPPGVSS